MDNDYKLQVRQSLDGMNEQDLINTYHNPGSLRLILALFGTELLITGEETPPAHDKRFGGSVRAKRPLNAFMAYRTYYMRLFPDIQQKTTSGFITQLWGRDPRRNKWALIAKVYSFIRDQIGKSRVNLASFLAVACPMMKIIEPVVYLRTLGWMKNIDDDGNLSLSQNVAMMSANLEALLDHQHPVTEIDLLTDILTAGYFEDVSQHLLVRLWASQNGLMTPSSAAIGDAVNNGESVYEVVPTTPEKLSFISEVHENTCHAVRDLLGADLDPAFFQSRFVHSWEVEDLTSFEDVQISIADAPMEPNTLYAFEQVPEALPQVSNFDMMQGIDTGVIDLASGWSVDKLMDVQNDVAKRAAEKAAQNSIQGDYRIYYYNKDI
ncbi:hypothetical protein FGRMN_1492 [Fusarium graminum]|nr:hypothetical protein FGRMN_1492 [Fusarium graminum]